MAKNYKLSTRVINIYYNADEIYPFGVCSINITRGSLLEVKYYLLSVLIISPSEIASQLKNSVQATNEEERTRSETR